MDEFRSAVARLGIARSDGELQRVVTEIDVDRSGEIEFNEFELLLSKVNERCTIGRLASELTRVRRDAGASPHSVIETVMRALRAPDEPYTHHGAEVAIRYCSPTNRASQLSPQGFAQYLREPWYAILCEWDEIEFEEAEEEGAVASVDVLVKRTADDSWTIVNWELSQHSGRWLTDALTIN